MTLCGWQDVQIQMLQLPFCNSKWGHLHCDLGWASAAALTSVIRIRLEIRFDTIQSFWNSRRVHGVYSEEQHLWWPSSCTTIRWTGILAPHYHPAITSGSHCTPLETSANGLTMCGVMLTWHHLGVGLSKRHQEPVWWGSKKPSMATVFGSEGKPHHNVWVPVVGLPNKVRVMLTMPSRHSMGAHEGKHICNLKKRVYYIIF